MTGKEFQEWTESLPEDDQSDVLLFAVRLVMDEKFPNMSLAELRDTVRRIYETRPNKTWDQFKAEMEEK